MSLTFDVAKNQPTTAGFAFDANGNMTGMPATPNNLGLAYDVENRTGGLMGLYDQQNQPLHLDGQWNLYGLRGERLETHTYTETLNLYWFPGAPYPFSYFTVADVRTSRNIYFGGRLIQSNGKTVVTDRLGSVRADEAGDKAGYYPYGEQVSGTMGQGREKFGTYTRESGTGLDYANQRYYASVFGRFNTADPYRASAGAGDPGSWNRYAFVGGDPANFLDPSGLQAYPAEFGNCDASMSAADCFGGASFRSGGGGSPGLTCDTGDPGFMASGWASSGLGCGGYRPAFFFAVGAGRDEDERAQPDPKCHVEIKFSEVRPFGIPTGYNHTMLQFFDSTGRTEVIDGGPVYSFAAGAFLLTPQVTPNGIYGNATSSTPYVSTLNTAQICAAWSHVAGIAKTFPAAVYGGITSNSNSLTSYLWGQLGQSLVGPPPGPNGTPGWNDPIGWYTPVGNLPF